MPIRHTRRPVRAVPLSGPAVALTFEREDGGSGATTATFHVPLADGDITPADLTARTQLLKIGGVEQPIYLTGLGRYASGNPRVLYGEVALTINNGQQIVGTLYLKQPRTLADPARVWNGFEDAVTKLPIQGTDAAGVLWLGRARAVGLPTDVARLALTGAFGPLSTKTQALALGVTAADMATYFARLDTWLRDYHWSGYSDAVVYMHTANAAFGSGAKDLTGAINVDPSFAQGTSAWDPASAVRPPNYYPWRTTIGPSGFGGGQNYYGADFIFFQAWLMTGDRAYYRRATAISWANQYHYRWDYAITNNNYPSIALSNNFDFLNGAPCDYFITGTRYTLPVNTVFATGSTAQIAANMWGVALLSVNAAGATTVTWATNAGAGYATEAAALAALPATPAGQAAIAKVTVQAGAALWVSHTSALAGGAGGTPAVVTRMDDYSAAMTPKYQQVTPYKTMSTGVLQTKGWAYHHLLTGDPEAKNATEQTADIGWNVALGDWTTGTGEARPQARQLEARLWAWAVNGALRNWGQVIEDGVTTAFGGTAWLHDGGTNYYWNNRDLGSNGCNGGTPSATGASPFMNMLSLNALSDIYDIYTPLSAANKSLILARMKQALDFWYGQWQGNPGSRPANAGYQPGIQYAIGPCFTSDADVAPAVDLSNLFPVNYAWYSRVAQDGVYRSIAERMFKHAIGTGVDGVAGPFLSALKQSREQYHLSLPFAAHLLGSPSALPIPSDASFSIVISGNAGVRAPGTSQLSATARVTANGYPIPKTFVWTSSNPLVATVDQTGLVTGLAAGSANIIASAGGVSSAAFAVTVSVPQHAKTTWADTTTFVVTTTGSGAAPTFNAGNIVLATSTTSAGTVRVLDATAYSLVVAGALGLQIRWVSHDAAAVGRLLMLDASNNGVAIDRSTGSAGYCRITNGVVGGALASIAFAPGDIHRFVKSGNDIIWSTSSDGGTTWTPRYTDVGGAATVAATVKGGFEIDTTGWGAISSMTIGAYVFN